LGRGRGREGEGRGGRKKGRGRIKEGERKGNEREKEKKGLGLPPKRQAWIRLCKLCIYDYVDHICPRRGHATICVAEKFATSLHVYCTVSVIFNDK